MVKTLPEERSEGALGVAEVFVQVPEGVAFVQGYMMAALGCDEGGKTARWGVFPETSLNIIVEDADKGLDEVFVSSLELVASLFVNDHALLFQEIPFLETGPNTVKDGVGAKHLEQADDPFRKGATGVFDRVRW